MAPSPDGCADGDAGGAAASPGEFNTDFYAARNKELVGIIQEAVGCFHCHKRDVTLRKCTGCRFTQYCNQVCQKADWKAGHKRNCVVIRGDHEVAQATSNNLIRLYAGYGYLNETLLMQEMEKYSDLFLDEFIRTTSSGERDMSLVVLCAEDANDITRLTVSAKFTDGEWNIHEICGVLFKTIDQGRDRLAMIYPPDGSHGSIADEKKGLVVSHLEAFVDKLQSRGVRIVMMTCGRGLTWLASDADEVGDELRGITRWAG